MITTDSRFDNMMIPNARDLIAMVANSDSGFLWSTAINNSARFPGMEPAGTLLNAEGSKFDLVVDGGYYKNFGAATAEDVLKTICQGTVTCGALRPIVIQISADPDYRGAAALLDDAQATAPAQLASDFLSEFLAPVGILQCAYRAGPLRRRVTQAAHQSRWQRVL